MQGFDISTIVTRRIPSSSSSAMQHQAVSGRFAVAESGADIDEAM